MRWFRGPYPLLRRWGDGLRSNPMGFFVGFLCFMTGVIYVFGLARPASLAAELDPVLLRYFGGLIATGGAFVCLGILRMNLPVERLGCRLVAISVVVYAIWTGLVVHWNATSTIALCLILAALCEVRANVIKRVFMFRDRS